MEVYDYYVTPEEYEIAAKNGISRGRVNVRIRQFGWSKRRAITEKVKFRNDYTEWLPIIKKNGISRETFRVRVSAGWTLERAATTPIMSKEDIVKISLGKLRKYPKEVVELAKSKGVGYSTFTYRINTLKWDIMKAATTPIMSAKERGALGREKVRKQVDNLYRIESMYKECRQKNIC